MSQSVQQHPFFQHDKFLLATFSSNCSGGMTHRPSTCTVCSIAGSRISASCCVCCAA